MNFISDAIGSDGVAAVIGKKAGDFVEDKINEVMGKGGGADGGGEQQQEKKGGFDPTDLLKLGGGSSDNKGGSDGFGVGDALKMVSGGNDNKGGLDVGDALGGFFSK